MAQNDTISVPAETWTELTDGDVTEITFQNLSAYAIFVQATDGSAPSDASGSVRYAPKQGELNAALGDIFPGATGAVRVWAYAPYNVRVMVSHA